jgi:hypothetical protein
MTEAERIAGIAEIAVIAGHRTTSHDIAEIGKSNLSPRRHRGKPFGCRYTRMNADLRIQTLKDAGK